MHIKQLENKLNQFENKYNIFLDIVESPINKKKTNEYSTINQNQSLSEIIKRITIHKEKTILPFQENNYQDLQEFKSTIGKKGLIEYLYLQEKEAENIKKELKFIPKENTEYIKKLLFNYLNAKKEAVYVNIFFTTS